jgi:hypothetical protein
MFNYVNLYIIVFKVNNVIFAAEFSQLGNYVVQLAL